MFSSAQSLPPALFAAFGLLVLAALAAPIFARNRRAAGIVHLVLTAAAAAVLLLIGFKAVFQGGMSEAQNIVLGPLTVPFLLDGLSGLFLIVLSFVVASSALYAVRYMDHDPEYGVGGFYAAFPLFVLGMAALLVVDDLSTGFTIAWQVMTVASFFLIRYEKRSAAGVRAASKYLVLMEAAWLLVLAGGAAAGGGVGDSLHEIGLKAEGLSGGGVLLVFGLLLLGFGLKAGVFPLGQLWMPDAYTAAPSPISALFSGVMCKAGIFGLIRVFFFLSPAVAGFDPRLWGAVLSTIGTLTLFIGTLQSVKQSDAKRLLAYSSIGQVGYIVLALGVALWTAGASDPAVRALAGVAMLGGLFHVLNHAAFKGLLFLSSGSLLYATGTKDLNKLGGLVKLMPVSAAVAAVASISIAGMPPTSGFASKWTIISASLLSGPASPVIVLFGIVALFTSAVTLACYVKFFGLSFTSSRSAVTSVKPVREVPLSMLVPKIILGSVIVLQGLLPFQFIGLVRSALNHSAGFPLAGGLETGFEASLAGLRIKDVYGVSLNAAAAPLIVLSLLVIAFFIAAFLRGSAGAKERTVPTWLCGYQQLDEKNRYVDRGMFAALKDFFRWTGGR
ncbi:MAG: hypothetical protein JW843_01000 [Candidatus Aminicenantes bacterium]|nr:hypothetical protein [Candidatus Aminicenantes bacterium]